MARYFYTNSAARPLKFGGVTFKFTPVSLLAGRMAGVYEATNEGEINLLVNAVNQRLGISEISAEDFERSKKKQQGIRPSNGSSLSRARSVQIPQVPALSVASRAGVASAAGNGNGQPAPVEVLPLPTVTSLMRVGTVRSPNPLVAEKDRIKNPFPARFPQPSAAAKKARAKAEKAAG